MKIENSCFKILFGTALALALGDSAYAATGNSIVHLDQENERVIAIDRIHLATLPASKRESIISNAAQTHGKGRVQDLPKSYGAFALGRQQDSCGSLTGKTFDTEFAPLEAEPDHYQARASRHEEPCMKPLDKPEAVYFAADPGPWGQAYGGSVWTSPLNPKFNPHNDEVCKRNTGDAVGVTYLKKTPKRAGWDWWSRYQSTITSLVVEVPLIEKKFGPVGNQGSVEKKFKGTISTNVSGEKWSLYDDTYFWLEDGHYWAHSWANELYSYNKSTGISTASGGIEDKIKWPIRKALTVSRGSIDIDGGVYWYGTIAHNQVYKNERAEREHKLTEVGYQEESAGGEIILETGVEMSWKFQQASSKVTVSLQSITQMLDAVGVRDFDYYCYGFSPQRYEHDDYIKNELKLKSAMEFQVGSIKFTISTSGTIYAKVTETGKLTVTQAADLANTTTDYAM
jgi:hypothetical protein